MSSIEDRDTCCVCVCVCRQNREWCTRAPYFCFGGGCGVVFASFAFTCWWILTYYLAYTVPASGHWPQPLRPALPFRMHVPSIYICHCVSLCPCLLWYIIRFQLLLLLVMMIFLVFFFAEFCTYIFNSFFTPFSSAYETLFVDGI